jgi:hypothetical protein
MGVSEGAIKLYFELFDRGLFKNIESVVEMGSQELHLTKDAFEGLVAAAGITNYREEDFPDLPNWPEQPRSSSKPFYEMLGAKKYSSIDLNGEHGSIPLDLNQPLTDASLWGKYDLVADHGTNEHVFNVVEAYRTMHRLCKPGGLMVHMQDVYGGNGYYNFDTAFFEGMASANGYRILFSSFVLNLMRKYLNVPEIRKQKAGTLDSRQRDQFLIPLSQELIEVINWSKDHAELGICYVFQKQSDDDFKIAYQGSFQSEDQGNLGYQLQFLPNPPSRTYIPLLVADLERELGAIRGGVVARHLLGRVKKRLKSRLRLR